jgi:putative membrane protein
MYNFVDMPAMVVALTLGAFLLISKANIVDIKQGWFHMKITFVALLVVCDVICGKWIQQLEMVPDTSKGIKYKILHGCTGLFLIAILFSVYVLHAKVVA